jgi:hypothetical protein
MAKKINKKLSVRQAVTYDEFLKQPSNTIFGDVQIDMSSLSTGCVQFNCANPTTSLDYTAFTHSKKVKIFPSYEGYITTALSLILGNGFISEKNQETLDNWLNFQSLTGQLNYEHLIDWFRDHIERKASVLYASKKTIETLKKERIVNVLAVDIEDSEGWNQDIIGIYYYQGESALKIPKFKLDDEVEKQIILSQKTQKLPKPFDDFWFISKKELVLLGNWDTILNPNASILDTDLARQQYVLEVQRFAIDEVSRDKIPALIFWTKDKSVEELARHMGVDTRLLATEEGKVKFMEDMNQKLKFSKDQSAGALPAHAGKQKSITANGGLYEKIEPIPANGTYLDDMQYIESIAQSVMANALGFPQAVLGAKADQHETAYKALLKFTQDTLIVWKQKYLNTKLKEVAEKAGLKLDISIEPKNYTDKVEEAQIDKLRAETSRVMIGEGIPTEQAYGWLNAQIGSEFKSENLRLGESQLSPLVNLDATIQ